MNKLSQRGYTIVETLAASVVIIISFAILGSSLTYMVKAREKTLVVSAVISLESQIQTALVDPANYADSTRTALAQQNVPNFNLLITRDDGSTWNIPVNSATGTFLNKSLQVCSGGSFSDPNCLYQVTVSLGYENQEPGYRYDIKLNPDILSRINVATLDLVNVGRDNYQVKIPSDFYKDESKNDCNGPSDIAVRGLNRATGEVECIKKPSTSSACPIATFPKGLHVVGQELKLICSNAAPFSTCPTNFSLSRIENQLLDQGISQGRCQWTAEKTSSYPNGAFRGYALKGTVCPLKYHLTNTCTTEETKYVQGRCKTTCVDWVETFACYGGSPGTPPIPAIPPSPGNPGRPGSPGTPPVPPTCPPPITHYKTCVGTYEPDSLGIRQTPTGTRDVDCAVIWPETPKPCPASCDQGCDGILAQREGRVVITPQCTLDAGIIESMPAR